MSKKKGIQPGLRSLSKTEKTILILLSRDLFKTSRSIPQDPDWEEVYQECLRQSAPILVWNALDKAQIPVDTVERWKNTVIASAYHNLQVAWQHLLVDRLMEKGRIPYVILKGSASGAYYPAPMDRIMGDVDFLVSPDHLERAGEILKAEGFIPWEEEHICHVVYRKENIHLEMHFEPAGVPYGKPGELVREYMKDVMEQAREIQVEGGKLRVPSRFHHGLILLLHTSHHLTGEGIGLRHLCDWAVFVATMTDEEFRQLFEEKLKAIGMWRFARLLTQTCIRYLGCPARPWTGKEEPDLTAAMIRDIFDGGNFGNKEENRKQEAYLISNRGKDGVGKRSILWQLAASMNEVVRTHMPAAQKFPVLLPLGWVFYGGRYWIRMMKGQRPKIQPREMLEGASSRRELYRQFGLFQREP